MKSVILFSLVLIAAAAVLAGMALIRWMAWCFGRGYYWEQRKAAG